jgi:plastocyanin
MKSTSSLAIATICLASSAFAQPGDHFDSNERAAKQIVILDASGRVVPNSPSPLSGQTIGVTVAPGGSLTFSPSTVNIYAGDSVKWTWAFGGHTVTSGSPCTADSAYCSPNDTNCPAGPASNGGATYTHTFNQTGTFSYFCRFHCGSGMTGTVNVAAPFVMITSVLYNGSGFTINGLTIPNATVTIQASPDLVTTFGDNHTATANGSGVFQFIDSSATSLTQQFYHVTYP